MQFPFDAESYLSSDKLGFACLSHLDFSNGSLSFPDHVREVLDTMGAASAAVGLFSARFRCSDWQISIFVLSGLVYAALHDIL